MCIILVLLISRKQEYIFWIVKEQPAFLHKRSLYESKCGIIKSTFVEIAGHVAVNISI